MKYSLEDIYQHFMLHCDTGPVWYWPDGEPVWYLEGEQCVSFEEWLTKSTCSEEKKVQLKLKYSSE